LDGTVGTGEGVGFAGGGVFFAAGAGFGSSTILGFLSGVSRTTR
jgi:hypothetical protein